MLEYVFAERCKNGKRGEGLGGPQKRSYQRNEFLAGDYLGLHCVGALNLDIWKRPKRARHRRLIRFLGGAAMTRLVSGRQMKDLKSGWPRKQRLRRKTKMPDSGVESEGESAGGAGKRETGGTGLHPMNRGRVKHREKAGGGGTEHYRAVSLARFSLPIGTHKKRFVYSAPCRLWGERTSFQSPKVGIGTGRGIER